MDGYRIQLTSLIYFVLILVVGAQPQDDAGPIRIWYGDNQQFGHMGQPQRWVNILGNVESQGLEMLTSSVNGDSNDTLSIGPDLHRLAESGDFNIEVGWDQFVSGSNHIMVTAYYQNGESYSTPTNIEITKGQSWPIPYYVNFREVQDLQEVVQIVDGHWELTSEGVRTRVPYYDRVLTMGDTSWHDYEATIMLTIHDWTPSQPGPPTYNVSHFGVAMRWRGHHTDGRQPNRKWYPLGAQGEFLLKQETDSCRWRILFDGRMKEKPPKYADLINSLSVNQAIRIKTQVSTLSDGKTRYRFKQWSKSSAEPEDWDVEGFEVQDYPSGALCLVPHNSDVTIHSVRVEPLQARGK